MPNRPVSREQAWLVPPTLDELVPADHPVRYVAATGTASWYLVGTPPVALRWVPLRDPARRFLPQALVCTDLVSSHSSAQDDLMVIPRARIDRLTDSLAFAA